MADNFGSVVKAFNAVRSCLKTKDDWKIKFRELYDTTYTCLWKSLLRMEKLDEALFVAERGRAQTLTDNLLFQYKLPASLLAVTIDLTETVSRLFIEVSLPALFLAIEGLTVNIWLLSKGKKVIFRKGRLEGDRTEKFPVPIRSSILLRSRNNASSLKTSTMRKRYIRLKLEQPETPEKP